MRCWRVALEDVAITEESTGLMEFLLARIEEDERIPDHVASVSPTADTAFCVWATQFAFDPGRMIVAIRISTRARRIRREVSDHRHIP